MGLTRPDGPNGPEGDVAGRADPPPGAVHRRSSAAGPLSSSTTIAVTLPLTIVKKVLLVVALGHSD